MRGQRGWIGLDCVALHGIGCEWSVSTTLTAVRLGLGVAGLSIREVDVDVDAYVDEGRERQAKERKEKTGPELPGGLNSKRAGKLVLLTLLYAEGNGTW